MGAEQLGQVSFDADILLDEQQHIMELPLTDVQVGARSTIHVSTQWG